MTSCPVCNKPVDPIRSRFVAVRNGKVTPYCSPECRDSQASQPTKMPAELTKPKTPVSGTPRIAVDPDSGPVIEILHEPASGVVTSAKDERTTQPTGKYAKEELDDKVEVKETKPRADHSKSSGGKDSAALAGEVIEKDSPKRARTRPSGKHLTRERKDSTEAKAGWDWLDEEPADESKARPGTITESERRARWPFIVLFLLVALGGGGFLAYKYVLKKQTKVVPDQVGSASAAPVAIDAAPAPVTPAAPTAESALADAKRVLLEAIENGTDRVQRLAAPALGRTGDPAAVAALQKAVKAERVAAHRIKLAYALARSGDKAGREALVAALALPDRSDKLDAATQLARLGDDRGKPLLQSLLSVSQHRLRAAEELARFKDPEALKLLEQVRSDSKSSVDEKATATIALYRAGTTKLEPDVKALLEEKSWRVPAAYALAEIAKDASVKADLVELATRGVGVKVRAAYALKKLVGTDTAELVPALVQALASQKDQEQFFAAEAILILLGDPQWSEYE